MTNVDRVSLTFKGHRLLITGATGFMGISFLERILRTTDVEEVYILIRVKKGKSPSERIKDIVNNPLFDTLRQEKNADEVFKKIKVVEGNCSVENLGMAEENWNILCEKITLIYHFAATTRFDSTLKAAMNLNCRGTHELINLARECKNLSLFCHISTAYCHLSETYLLEKSYIPPYNPHEFMHRVDQLSECEAKILEKKCLNKSIPNTYVLTKSLAEALVVEALELYKLPVLILRPSIVTPTYKIPVAGWVNDFNGLGGLLIAIGKGVFRSMQCNDKFHGDFIPVDLANGAAMVCAWNYLSLNDKNTFIFNFTTSNLISLNWGEVLKRGMKVWTEKYPMKQLLWYPNITLTKYHWLHKIRSIFYHWIPAIIIDTLLFCIRKKPFLWRVQKKIAKGIEGLNTFTNNQWEFDNSNILRVRTLLNDVESEKYNVTLDGLHIDEYIENSVLGGHRYLLKGTCSEEDFAKGRKTVKILYFVDRTLKLLICGVIIYFLLSYIFSFVKSFI